ncbi:MAG: histidine phosphatase family protein [Methylococcales bacterium]|nr:histidine phosphatase family protein [Methylococcales bacterium]
MFITFLRHATAEDRKLAIPDAERALTDKGEKQVKRVAAFCQANQLLPGVIFSSALLRAQQTAKVLQSNLPDCPLPQIVTWLNTDSSPEIIIAELALLDNQGVDDVWLVGHEPAFSSVIAQLLHADDGNIIVKKASLTHLEADFVIQPNAKLLWSLPCGLMP